jgi:hypothetical protein
VKQWLNIGRFVDVMIVFVIVTDINFEVMKITAIKLWCCGLIRSVLLSDADV